MVHRTAQRPRDVTKPSPFVLVVDDEGDLADAMRYYLEHMGGYTVYDVGSAEQALAVVAE
jgi:CheY-like chemotaxis protein